MLERIIEIAKGICEEDVDLGEDTSIMMDMELSSLEFFQFICSIEDAFGVKISERDLSRVDTLGDIAELVRKK